MTKAMLVALCALTAGTAYGQYKCLDSTGRVTFQQSPCAAADKQQKLIVRGTDAPTAPAATPSPRPTQSVDQRMLATLEKERRVRELQQNIAATEEAIHQRSGMMAAEMRMLRERKSFANNNLAGASLEQSISSEMQAVAQKYKAMNDVDIEQLKALRAELAAAQSITAR